MGMSFDRLTSETIDGIKCTLYRELNQSDLSVTYIVKCVDEEDSQKMLCISEKHCLLKDGPYDGYTAEYILRDILEKGLKDMEEV